MPHIFSLLLLAVTAGWRAARHPGSACSRSALTRDRSAFNSLSLGGSHFVHSFWKKGREKSPTCDRGFSVLSQQAATRLLVQFHNRHWAQYLRLAKLLPGVSTDRPDSPGPLPPEKCRGKLQLLIQLIFCQRTKSLNRSGVKKKPQQAVCSHPSLPPSPYQQGRKTCCYR